MALTQNRVAAELFVGEFTRSISEALEILLETLNRHNMCYCVTVL